jgi:hypothetical protein
LYREVLHVAFPCDSVELYLQLCKIREKYILTELFKRSWQRYDYLMPKKINV